MNAVCAKKSFIFGLIFCIQFIQIGCAFTKQNHPSQPILDVSTVEFIKQDLNPTGGYVFMPKGWYFVERHRSIKSLNWVVSKENPKNGYETGQSIQFMLGIKDGTKMSPKEFIQKIIIQIKKTSHVLSEECSESNQGEFERICLRTKEIKNRNNFPVEYIVQNSLFWNDDMDAVAIIVSGSPVADWDKYSKYLDRMNEIVLIDHKIMNLTE